MPKRLQLAEHLDMDELYRRYRKAKNPVERTHWQIVWLKSQGKKTNEIARATGYSSVWVRQVIHRYNDEGPDGLIDRRKFNPGATPLLDDHEQEMLRDALQRPAPDGGAWNSRKVAEWIADRTGRDTVHPQRGWDYLKRLRDDVDLATQPSASGSDASSSAYA